MISTLIRLTEFQYYFLHKLQGTLSEHIRNAVNKYIDDLNKNSISSSLSDKEGDKHGK